ncbi:unnamed protein product [Durusdinium trenchii]|uniref:Uncharacterized protein n=2 Tax=Durusdinium trenchii TaxID=1381693 RepID=A0ABP0QWY0_9DINO
MAHHADPTRLRFTFRRGFHGRSGALCFILCLLAGWTFAPPPRSGVRRCAQPEISTPADEWVDSVWNGAKDLLDSDAGRGLRGLVGEERLESVKAGLTAVGSGAVAMVPISLLDPDRLTPRWEFQLDMLALDIFLFGVVYRYAVRAGDDNPMLRTGVIGAFVLPRALFLVQMPAECQALPLNCGEPLGYFSWAMLAQVAWQGFAGAVVFAVAFYGLERAITCGLVQRFRTQN